MSQHRSHLSWSCLGKALCCSIPGFKPLGSAEPDDPGHSTVCSRGWEFPSPLSPPAEPPSPDLCFLLTSGENTQPSTLTQHQCHPGDSQRASLVTRDSLLYLGTATSPLMAALNPAGSSGNSLCPKRSHAGMACAFADRTGQLEDGDGKMAGSRGGPTGWQLPALVLGIQEARKGRRYVGHPETGDVCGSHAPRT